MTDYKPGDKVTLEHPDGSRLVREILEGRDDAHPERELLTVRGILGGDQPLYLVLALGWTVTSHEPVVELPTKAGFYWSEAGFYWSEASGSLWLLSGHQGDLRWHELDGLKFEDRSVFLAITSVPFDRYRPADEVAAEVIDWLESEYRGGITNQVMARTRQHFGVEVDR